MHEPAGWCLFGSAWHGRRLNVLAVVPEDGVLLDVGCGSGRLLREAEDRGMPTVGVDPSIRALELSNDPALNLVCGVGCALPVTSGSIRTIVCTYPGNWIRKSEVWSEFQRVLVPGGVVVVLLGGTVAKGPAHRLRAALLRLVYGQKQTDVIAFNPPAFDGGKITGTLEAKIDTWGTAYIWTGERLPG